MSAVPENYWRVISPLIVKAREFLEEGQTLSPIAFVGSFSSGKIIPVILQAASDEAKDNSALAIRMAAQSADADFVFVLMEAWSLRKDKLPQVEKIMEWYGSIGASPYRIDVVSMALETRHGLWMAQVPIKPKGYSKKKRTMGSPMFQHFAEYEGRFSNLLPKKDDELPSTLH